MKKISLHSVSLLVLLVLSLINCKKNKEPSPAGSGTSNPAPTITSFSPTSGSAGMRVVIVGTGFSTILSNNKVRFGNTEAPLDSATAKRLVTRVPKDIATGKITVEVGGKLATTATDFTVQHVPAAFTGTGGVGGTANVASDVTISSAKAASTIEKEGSNSIIQHGHIWSLNRAQPTLEGFDSVTEGKSELGLLPVNTVFPYTFSSELKTLEPGTAYYVRAYAITSQGTTYGPVTQIQTKKPCLLTSVTEGGRDYQTLEYDSKGRITVLNNPSSYTSKFTYDAEGQLEGYYSKVGDSFTNESYAYAGGRLSRLERTSSYFNKVTRTYDYDGQGKLAKKVETSAENRVEWTYEQGVLKSIVSTSGGKPAGVYTVSDGLLTRRDDGKGTVQTYAYDALGNLTKTEIFTNGKRTAWFESKYDSKPNVGMAFFPLKGWLPEQVREGNFFFLLSGGKSANNVTEESSNQYDTKGVLTTRTDRIIYTYKGERLTGRTYTVFIPDVKPSLRVYVYNYSGDCN
ncbi:IPT/TIG domain-containing protein [Salmonirosea aquatica]|uniref:IPT/TIG domain-containing protein n=1 Tax=Salmonirosea aquatica TaxID=2654236 RepID=A0A7C9FZQ7_9BACT|nr:hypothetical protein [Cytophagaceae bacterium SJW1-29]